MSDWWISVDVSLPEPGRIVHAKDDEDHYFEAIKATSAGWGYAEAHRFGVSAIVKFWRPNHIWDLLAWLYDNHGVLVTPDAAGQWTCQNCGRRNLDAYKIEHKEDCLYKLALKDLL